MLRRAAVVCVMAAAALPAPAAANPLLDKAQANLDIVGLSAAAGAAGLLILLGLGIWLHRIFRARGRLLGRGAQGMLAATGTECLVRRRNGTLVGSAGLPAMLDIAPRRGLKIEDILAAFETAPAAQLTTAITELTSTGNAFRLTLKTRAGRHVRIDGGPGRKGEAFLLADVTEHAGPLESRDGQYDRLRSLVDSLPLPMWSRDHLLSIQDCNTAYVKAVEADTLDQVVEEGREFAEGNLATSARTLAQRALQSGLAQTESHHIVVGGQRRLYDLTEVPLGNAGQTAGFALDTTILEEVHQDLTRVVRAHDDVLERLATAIAIFGPDRRITFFNSAFARIWELEEEWLTSNPELNEILDRLRDRRMVPETGDFRAFKEEWDGHFTSLMTPREELMYLPNGQAIWTVISPHPFGGILVTFEDVTDRLTLERSYNTLIDVQRETLDNLEEGVAVFGEDDCIKLSNPAFRALWELDEEYLTGNPHVRDILGRCEPLIRYGKDFDEFASGFLGQLASRDTQTGVWNRTDDKVVGWGLVPLPDGGALFSCSDMSDAIRVERALRERNEALEAADRLKSEFVANVSYELRTPLNTIIGFTKILDNNYFGELNGRQQEYVQGILEASSRLLSLINDILDLAVIEAGRMVLDLQPVKVNELLQSVAVLTSEWAREQDLSIRFNCPPDVGEVRADESRLKHALFNLISNAIKFTPPGGSIVVSASRQANDLRLVVEDTGAGIEGEDQEKVFGKFVQGENASSRQAGAGLGLSLVKSLIELHGGKVEIESTPGEGTKVVCILPAGATDLSATDPMPPMGDTGDAEQGVAAE